MKCHTTDELHVEVAHAHDALTRLTYNGKCFRQQLVQGLAVAQALAELISLGGQGSIVERRHGFFQGVDLLDGFPHALEFAVVAGTEDFLES